MLLPTHKTLPDTATDGHPASAIAAAVQGLSGSNVAEILTALKAAIDAVELTPGPQGPAGADGATGADGAPGPAGPNPFKGGWTPTDTYAIGDLVEYNSRLYLAVADSTNQEPLLFTFQDPLVSEALTPDTNADGTPTEIGLAFGTSVQVNCHGVKFWKPTNCGISRFTVKLWLRRLLRALKTTYIPDPGWSAIYFDTPVTLDANVWDFAVSVNMDHFPSNPNEFDGPDVDHGLITTFYNSGRRAGDWVIDESPQNGSGTGYFVYPIVDHSETNEAYWSPVT